MSPTLIPHHPIHRDNVYANFGLDPTVVHISSAYISRLIVPMALEVKDFMN